jgi:hypothetical protein
MLEITPACAITFDRLSLVETADMRDFGDGFSLERHYRVQRFTIEAQSQAGWKQIYAGRGIGSTLALKIPRITATKLRITIQESTGPAGFDHIGAYNSRDYGRG